MSEPSEEEQRDHWKRHEALKAADALNHMFGPALNAYHKEKLRLAKIAGRPLYTCLPGEGEIVVYPETNEPIAEPLPDLPKPEARQAP
jgi:hypothetical protein